MLHDEPGTTCKQTMITNTHTALESKVVCTGQHPSTMQMHFDALSPTSVKGTMKSTTTEGGKTMTGDVTMTAKWLGANCGDVK